MSSMTRTSPLMAQGDGVAEGRFCLYLNTPRGGPTSPRNPRLLVALGRYSSLPLGGRVYTGDGPLGVESSVGKSPATPFDDASPSAL